MPAGWLAAGTPGTATGCVSVWVERPAILATMNKAFVRENDDADDDDDLEPEQLKVPGGKNYITRACLGLQM